MLRKNICADLLKLKGLPIIWAHILIPVITSGLFLLYDSFAIWNEETKLTAFYQAIGAGFPVLIGIFTASMAQQEQNAGCFQNLLSLPKKTVAFLSKLAVLLIFSLFSVLLAAAIFGFGFCERNGSGISGIGICMMAAVLMWCSSIPLYLWQMILAFQFGKGVSVGAGILSGLVSALMLTGLGDYVWKYTFISWTGRIPDTYLRLVLGETNVSNELRTVIVIYCLFTLAGMIYYLLWSSQWEGNRISE
ncbi:MAG: lantibiotic immunity ABC transporter MutG family permease subunit [bacterium]|nr:lantibiotic immunity ABC transporter MutG family permease subunit [bacterium]